MTKFTFFQSDREKTMLLAGFVLSNLLWVTAFIALGGRFILPHPLP
jgi:predicted small integral membrane protein